MNNSEYQRLLELKELISKGKATVSDKKEYMSILYKYGSITKEQYDDFLSDRNTDVIIGAALTIGAILLTAWLIGKLIE